jgi:hypothetical protein
MLSSKIHAFLSLPHKIVIKSRFSIAKRVFANPLQALVQKGIHLSGH